MEKPLISVVVLSHNYGRFLPQCLESVLNRQRGVGSLELIVIDDASEDETPDLAKQYQSDSRVKWIRHSRNWGHIESANEGLALSEGDYILRLDADDFLAEGFFVSALAAFRKYPDAGLVYGNFDLMDEDSRITKKAADQIHGGKDFVGFEVEKLIFNNFICPSAILVRREAWESVGFRYDENVFYGEDWWTWLRIGLKNPFVYLNQVVSRFRVHSRSLRGTLLRSGRTESSIRYVLDSFFPLEGVPDSLVSRRAEVYVKHFRWLADVYFSAGMRTDCLRCLGEARRWDPCQRVRFSWLLRGLTASVPPAAYRRCRAVYEWFT